jgi:hypothetical protein
VTSAQIRLPALAHWRTGANLNKSGTRAAVTGTGAFLLPALASAHSVTH